MNKGAFITGLAGCELSAQEYLFLRERKPFGAILFARNVRDPQQIVTLCAAIREALQDEQAVIFVDQEGGRVQRLRQPHWAQYAPARPFGRLYRQNPEDGREAVRLQSRLIGDDLRALGFNGVCSPCLDMSVPGAHEVIGDRAYAADPAIIAELGRASMEGTLAAGVLPVIKHIPGHGRSLADSHFELPRVEAGRDVLRQADFRPFKALADAPFAMTAHIVYSAFDDTLPATLSQTMINDVIRGEIGFSGALMSDDLGMKALKGSFADLARACRAVDIDLVLHCSGRLEEMVAVADGVGRLEGVSAERCHAALARLRRPEPLARGAAEIRLAEFLAMVGEEKTYALAQTPASEVLDG